MREKLLRWKDFVVKYGNVLFFIGGFIFDTFTMVRVDSTIDLAIEIVYLAAVVLMIIWQTRFSLGLWKPQGRMEKIWEHESEAIHFFYGGLLSANVIFYFKSTTLSRGLLFFALVLALMVFNEMPQIRRAGHKMRLGLYAFCLVSFFNYLLPVIIGRMGDLIFIAGLLMAAALSAWLVHVLAKLYPDPLDARFQLGWPPAAVLFLVGFFYAFKLIPPVPLSMQYAGVFHNVERDGGKFKLSYEKPEWYKFWMRHDGDYKARPGDQVFLFTRVFAPRHFRHEIFLRWFKQNEKNGKWEPSDRIALPIYGGREEGFRGYGVKSNYAPGEWRVDVEVEDGRALGGVRFRIDPDSSTDERQWESRLM